ncbi:iron complex transport system permease protein [Arcanobacterium pluranimalium]|uniref:FecCD family ABC transporter permease n=1 Tax=Arcanobacterium pluranimalium TaxID=108028 RepID=UPI00195B7964|nr:iron ABC transporter permease [Arcanobacterium pluranimalium]MBM7825783.1 iron complex transport system permease protein [Arcanobacterium pluranimalium]
MLQNRCARVWFMVCLGALLLVVSILGIAIGASNIPLSTVVSGTWQAISETWQAISGANLSQTATGVLDASGTQDVDLQIISEIRLPRVVLGLLVGAGLAMCGLITQSLLRNPLGDPYILGISSGASTGAALVIVLGSSHALLSTIGVTAGAFIGALTAIICVGLLANVGGRVTPARIVFAGMAVSYMFSALTSLITILAKNAAGTKSVLFWTLGSLSAASWSDVLMAACATCLAFALFFLLGRRVDVLNLGDDAARSLGTNPKTYRNVLIVIVAFTVATLVSLSGSIGFIGLVVPHLAKVFVGSTMRAALPVAFVLGGILVVAADICARVIVRPAELPIGILTALVGTPMLMILIKKHAQK